MLEGLKIIEMATYVAAPAAGGMLRDWGAEVIKIEPLAGCPMRKFFEGLPFDYKNNCEILYPAINELKSFPKKEKIIIFTGKLNSSKGYDIFGKAILNILEKFKDWKAFAIGNERRETHNFKHNNFKVIDWLPHEKILGFYKKCSISVVCSRWQEPFGRTAMESAAYGCATITSNRGGLCETFNNNLVLDDLSVAALEKLIGIYKDKNQILSVRLKALDILSNNNQSPILKTSLEQTIINTEAYPLTMAIFRIFRASRHYRREILDKMALGSDAMLDLGNLYTAALPAWMAAGFEQALDENIELAGQEILTLGYGSGDAAEIIPMRVTDTWREAAKLINFSKIERNLNEPP